MRKGRCWGLHTGTAGHVSDTSLSQTELEWSLRKGTDDIRFIMDDQTMFVRPPYWRFSADTRAGYHRQGLHMMLSDAKAYDRVDCDQLIEEAAPAEPPLDKKPCYDSAPEIMQDSLRRAVSSNEAVRAGARYGEAASPCPHK